MVLGPALQSPTDKRTPLQPAQVVLVDKDGVDAAAPTAVAPTDASPSVPLSAGKMQVTGGSTPPQQDKSPKKRKLEGLSPPPLTQQQQQQQQQQQSSRKSCTAAVDTPDSLETENSRKEGKDDEERVDDGECR